MKYTARIGILIMGLLLFSQCSVRKMALKSLSGTFENAMDVFASDNDPELIRDSMPLTLKMIEVMLQETPDDPSLLLAASSGFAMYSYAFLLQESEMLSEEDLLSSRELRRRAEKMFYRSLDYGIRGLESKHPGFWEELKTDPEAALGKTTREDIPLMYWTAVSLGSVVGLDSENYELVINLPLAGMLVERCLELNGEWGNGSLHEFMISYEAGRAGYGGSIDKARSHYQQALEINGGQSAGTYVTAAEVFAIPDQDRKQFVDLLNKALEVDVDKNPKNRLANVIAQRKARWLLENADLFFID